MYSRVSGYAKFPTPEILIKNMVKHVLPVPSKQIISFCSLGNFLNIASVNEFTHTNLLSLVAFCMSNFMTSDVTLLHTESKETSIMHGNNHVHYVHGGSDKII